MTTKTHKNDIQTGVVKDLRKIRDQISHEIKEMTFDQERAYLDNLLPKKKSDSSQKRNK